MSRMICVITWVCAILGMNSWISALDVNELYSLYEHANHYWDFNLPENIVDNITSKQGESKHDVEVTRSLTGTGLRTKDSGQIILEPVLVAECPVEPSKCTNGLTVSVFLKVVGTFAQFKDGSYILGNAVSEQLNGFVVEISERELKVVVKTEEYVCRCFHHPAMVNVWFHLGFSWKDPDLPDGGLTVYIDRKRIKTENEKCDRRSGRRPAFTKIELGSPLDGGLAVEFDNLAIWYKKLNRITAPWNYVTENSRIPIDAYLDVALIDLPWNPNLAVEGSNEHNDLVDVFNYQMGNLNNSVYGNVSKAKISSFRERNGKTSAHMYLRLYRSFWKTLLHLQEALEGGSVLKSRVDVLDCSANDDSFCHVPTIDTATSEPYRLQLQVTHLDGEDTSILLGYNVIYRQLGSPSWEVQITRRSVFSSGMNIYINSLKPYRNYTFRVFPFSPLGDRLGSKLKMFQTTEKEPSVAPNITKLINTSSTSLLVTWLHNIPPEHYNGIFLGYRVRWTEEPHTSDLGSMEFGTDVDSYNITDLKKYQWYRVYVAGRSHGGVGVENYDEAMTDEDVPTKGPTKLTVCATGRSSLRAEWDVVPLCCRYGNIRGYEVLLLDHDSRKIVRNVYVNKSTLSLEFHGLLTFYTYDVSVAAFTKTGSGVASENGTVTGEAAPANPPNVFGQSHDSTSISVQWSFNKSARNVLGVLQGFQVHYVRQDGRSFPLVTTGPDESSLTIIDLKPYTEYNVTVGAFTMAGGTNSSSVVVRTQQDVPGAPPDNVLAYNISSTEIKVHWGSIPLDYQNGIILGYHVIVMLNSSIINNLTALADTREMVVTDLQESTTYQVFTSGFTVKGRGVQSNPVNVTTDKSRRSDAITCDANPSSGVAVETTFALSCANWHDRSNTPRLYDLTLPLAKGLTTILWYGYSANAEVVLPPGDPLKNNSLTIHVGTMSPTGSKENSSTDVQVFPWPSISTQEASVETLRLLEGPFSAQIDEGDLKRATQLAIGVLKSLELQQSGTVSKEDRSKIKQVIIRKLREVEIHDLAELVQISSAMSLAMDDPTDLKQEVMQSIKQMLQGMTDLLVNISSRRDVMELLYLETAETNLIYALGKYIHACSSRREANITALSLDTLSSLKLLRRVMRSVAEKKLIGEEATVIYTELIEILVARLHPDGVPGSMLTLETGSVQLPDSADVAQVLSGFENFVDVEVVSSLVNFFHWDSSADLITSRLLAIDLRGESGEVVKVQNLTTDIQLGIQLSEEAPKTDANPAKTASFAKLEHMQFHRLEVARVQASYSITITTKESLNVFVKFGRKPSLEDHDRNYTLPDFSSCTRSSGRNEEEEYNCTQHPHQIFLGSDFLQKPGVYYLGILYSRNISADNYPLRKRRSCFSTTRAKRSCVETRDPPPSLGVYKESIIPPYDPRVDMNYTIQTDEISCRFWSHDEEKWITEGCKVGSQSTKHRLLCLCNHLTSFGGGLLIAPNPIDMDTVFKELSRLDETGNFGVLLTIIFVFCMYLIAIVLANGADRKDQTKLGPKIVLETEGDLIHQYEVTISTGVWPDSGTTAKVTMVFYGTSGNSGPITVSRDFDPPRVLFSRGSVDKYVMSLSTSLGPLHYAYIWHDNSGESPSWFLDYVVVRSKDSGDEWKFVCNQWFCPERDDGKIMRKLLVKRTNYFPRFQEAFRLKVSATLYESHLWMSSVTKRPGSSFTRVQRVTCCLCVVSTAMLANAMFFNLSGEAEGTIKIGPLKVSMRQIIITLQSCLIIAPINFLIVIIFKNSKPTFGKCCGKVYRVTEEEGPDDDDKPLHHVFVHGAWFLCFATAITSATVVFFYSLMWGKETADEWLSSIVLSITMDILAIQPVRLVILAAVAAIVITKAKQTKERLSSRKRLTGREEQCFEDVEPPEIYNGALPDAMQLEWYKKYKEKETRTLSAFKSLTFFTLFMLVLGIVCYGSRDYHHYLMVEEVKAIFPRAEQVGDSLGFWTWMTNIFAPGIYTTNWYNGGDQNNTAYISDKVSIFVGMPRIRQLRIRQASCPKRLAERYNISEECYPFYSMSCEDNTPMYLPKWKHPPSDTSASLFKTLCPKPWRYQSSDDMDNLPWSSPRAAYGGGGYVADLGYDLQTASGVMENLNENNWIDRRTRALIVEFSIFNSNMNILAIANYFFEFMPTGGVHTYVRIEMVDLQGSETSLFQLVLVSRLLVIVMIVVYFVVQLVKMCRQKVTYFKNVWNLIALVLIFASVTAVVLHIVQEKTTSDSVKELNKNLYAAVSFHKALSLLDIETTIFSVVIFLATLKFMTVLRFSRQIIFLSTTVRFAAKYLASFSIVFFVIFCSFAISGMLAFGALVESYSSFLRVCVSQFEFLLGKAVPNFQMAKVDPLLAFLFSSFYICSMTVFFLNLFIVILNYALGEVKDNLDAVTDELDLANFMTLYLTQGISNIFGRKKGRNSKLYCENISFEDDCAYVENRLDEITRRMSIMAEGISTEANACLIKPKIQTPEADPCENQKRESRNHLEETLNCEEVSPTSSSERDVVMEDDDSSPLHPMALFTIVEMEETDEERNKPTLSSEVNLISDDLNSWL